MEQVKNRSEMQWVRYRKRPCPTCDEYLPIGFVRQCDACRTAKKPLSEADREFEARGSLDVTETVTRADITEGRLVEGEPCPLCGRKVPLSSAEKQRRHRQRVKSDV